MCPVSSITSEPVASAGSPCKSATPLPLPCCWASGVNFASLSLRILWSQAIPQHQRDAQSSLTGRGECNSYVLPQFTLSLNEKWWRARRSKVIPLGLTSGKWLRVSPCCSWGSCCCPSRAVSDTCPLLHHRDGQRCVWFCCLPFLRASTTVIVAGH